MALSINILHLRNTRRQKVSLNMETFVLLINLTRNTNNTYRFLVPDRDR